MKNKKIWTYLCAYFVALAESSLPDIYSFKHFDPISGFEWKKEETYNTKKPSRCDSPVILPFSILPSPDNCITAFLYSREVETEVIMATILQ